MNFREAHERGSALMRSLREADREAHERLDKGLCLFCGKPDTDAATMKTWAPVHADCAAKYRVSVWGRDRPA